MSAAPVLASVPLEQLLDAASAEAYFEGVDGREALLVAAAFLVAERTGSCNGCRRCGRSLAGRAPEAVYCSGDCRLAAWREREQVEPAPHVCARAGCGEPLGRRNARWCSEACRQRAVRARARQVEAVA